MHSDTWCPLPFVSLTIHPSNKITHCMMSEYKMADVYEDNSWNNAKFQELRKNMLENKWTLGNSGDCTNCYNKEKNNLFSQRKNWLSKNILPVGAYENANKLVNNTVYHLNLNLNNICNFKCRMCTPNYSNSLINDFNFLIDNNVITRKWFPTDIKKQLDVNQFFMNFGEKLNSLQSINVTGGEPFINDTLFTFIDKLGKYTDLSKIHISICTNGSKIDFNKMDVFDCFKSIFLDVSVDAVGKLFEYMRSSGVFTWEEMEEKLFKSSDWEKQNSNRNLMVNASFQIYNSYNIDHFYKFFLNGITDKIQYRILTSPSFLSVSNLPEKNKIEVKEKIENLIEFVENKNVNTDPLKNCLNALILKRDTGEWEKFKKFTFFLDKYQNKNITNFCKFLFTD